MLSRWTAGAAAALLLAGCRAAGDSTPIEAAALAYVREAGGAPGAARVEEVSGDYARALVTPEAEGSTDPAWVFLRREGETWQGLVYGTAIGPEEYEELGIPPTLRPD